MGGVNHFVTLGRWAKVVLEAVLKVGIFLTLSLIHICGCLQNNKRKGEENMRKKSTRLLSAALAVCMICLLYTSILLAVVWPIP